MDLLIVEYWLLIFVGIVLFLGGLTYNILQKNLIEKFDLEYMNHQGRRSSANNRRKNARNANKRKQQQTTNTNVNNNETNEEEEQKTILPEITSENDESEHSRQLSDEEKENYDDSIQTEQMISSSPPPSTHVEDEQEPTISIKQCHKNKTINTSLSQEESPAPLKPQASVAPVKQTPLTLSIKNSSDNFKSSQNHQDNYSKTNGHSTSSSSCNIYTYSFYNSLPPRFQQQRDQQQQEAIYHTRRYRRRRGGRPPKRSSFPPDSAARSNDFIPLSLQQQQQEQQQQQQQQHHHHHHHHHHQQQQQQQFNDHQIEPTINYIQQPPQELSMNNGYSSESDILMSSPSTIGNNSISPLLSTSTGSQSSLQRLDLVRSLTSSSYGLVDELVSIFDTITFSSDEIELILNKIATKHVVDKHDIQRLISTAKNDKTLERILEETYRSQAKILAIELQTEKNRVLELTKSNADMENTIRQFQQQQPNNMVQYQQMVLPYQMQLRRLGDENARLQHQLHAYSMMPVTLNELKQQQHILNEQIRQMDIRNSALESEVAESERESKRAAEIYKKADAQKQERIEQMIADINKYKKLDKELTNLRQKHSELEKNFNTKINEITNQRDELQIEYDQLKEKVEQYEQLKIKYDKLKKNSTNYFEQELNDLKTENDQLRQSNWKNMEELNKLLNEQKQNQTISSPSSSS